MLSPAAEDVEVLVDPFHGGEVCFLEDAADKLARVHGLKVRVCCCLTVASGMKWLAMSSAAIALLLLLPLLCSGMLIGTQWLSTSFSVPSTIYPLCRHAAWQDRHQPCCRAQQVGQCRHAPQVSGKSSALHVQCCRKQLLRH
jgi:hypothetical protein